jgi:hypothetical protein
MWFTRLVSRWDKGVFPEEIAARIRMQRIACFAFLALFSFVSCLQASERFFLLVFGAQRPFVNAAHLSHSWATFVRVVDLGPDPMCVHIETVTISWMPQTLELQLLDFPKKGVNLGLHATMAWAKENGLRVSYFGPYQIDKSLYDDALAKATQLASGVTRYQVINIGNNFQNVSNCINAVADVAVGSPRIRVGRLHGDSASYYLTVNFKPWILDVEHTHDWLLPGLGLNPYSLKRWDLETFKP